MTGPYPLNALRAFEAVARNRSFALAARELQVTPSAVGQLVARLEKDFGIDLFARPRRGPGDLSLTPRAANALPDLQEGFASLSRAVTYLERGG
ncbi:MAG: LysR family transcriptional regulator [Novosphingobium sp.]